MGYSGVGTGWTLPCWCPSSWRACKGGEGRGRGRPGRADIFKVSGFRLEFVVLNPEHRGQAGEGGQAGRSGAGQAGRGCGDAVEQGCWPGEQAAIPGLRGGTPSRPGQVYRWYPQQAIPGLQGVPPAGHTRPTRGGEHGTSIKPGLRTCHMTHTRPTRGGEHGTSIKSGRRTCHMTHPPGPPSIGPAGQSAAPSRSGRQGCRSRSSTWWPCTCVHHHAQAGRGAGVGAVRGGPAHVCTITLKQAGVQE